jgi:hypothetical protein
MHTTQEEVYSSELDSSTGAKKRRPYVSPPVSTSTHEQNAAQKVSAMIAAATTHQDHSISSNGKKPHGGETPRRFSSQTHVMNGIGSLVETHH